MINRMIKHFRRWNIWRKRSLNGPMHKLLVLFGVIKSPTFLTLKEAEGERHYVRRDLILKAYTDLLQREGAIFTTDVTDALMAVPLEDAVPVKHGEWIRCGDGENVPYQCSRCGKIVPEILVENWVGVKYCPMCGALMDKEGDRET